MIKDKRKIKYLVEGVQTSDGAGVNLTRIIGSPEFNMLDPFLLLDAVSYTHLTLPTTPYV